jgi:hypothetical protein
MFFRIFFAKRGRISLFNSYSAFRAMAKTRAKAVAINLFYKLGFPIYYLKRAFSAIRDTKPAASAFLLIYPDNFTL